MSQNLGNQMAIKLQEAHNTTQKGQKRNSPHHITFKTLNAQNKGF